MTTIALFALIGVVGVIKKNKHSKEELTLVVHEENYTSGLKQEIPAFLTETITYEKPPIPVKVKSPEPVIREKAPTPAKVKLVEEIKIVELKIIEPKLIESKLIESRLVESQLSESTLPESSGNVDVDRISRLFTTGKGKLPFVETVSYKSRVAWLQGRPAWIADYASYYTTSRHFIARSLNGNRDYYTQKVSSGDFFNVFQKDKDIRFNLIVDLAKLKMWFYAYDADLNIRYLLKTYKVGCGKVDKDSPSGSLTPLGTFTLGDKIAIYKPGVEGFFKDQKIEMIRVFGTRWIPYAGEQDETLALLKGFGMHGIPWFYDETTGELMENRESIGCYDSSGCLRLLQEDIEELFAIVITKPTTVQIVKNFQDARLPGIEWIDNVVISSNQEK